MKIADMLHAFLIFFIISAAFGWGVIVVVTNYSYINLSKLEQSEGKPSALLDDEGNVWDYFQRERHAQIHLSELPSHLIQAFIAAEDHNFFKHKGISWTGILRSLLINCYYGRIVQGASTITQQLVKLLFTDATRTFKRKIKEQFFAILIEQQLSKEQILEAYLNNIYFGGGLYGVEAASQRFWGISARDILLDQAAILAAIVKNPAHYYPLWYPLSAQRRRNIVLRSMHQLGYIDQSTYEKTREIPLNIHTERNNHTMPYIKETIRQWLEPIVGRDVLYEGGLRIATTINQKTQECAEQAFIKRVTQLRKKGMATLDGGLCSIDVKSGHIKALIGGFDFSASQFNRVFQARRQLGSIIKPLIFALAVEEGISLTTTADDEPLSMAINDTVWEPRNSTRVFEGTMTLARALATSNNIIAIKVLLTVGPQRLIEVARKCMLEGDMYPYPSLALGCVDCTVKEVAGMFNIFANNGRYVEPHLVRWVRDMNGKKIVEIHLKQEQIISPEACGQIMSVLRHGIERACLKAGVSWAGGEAIGKTGTTNDARTVSFAGSTPSLTTVVYLGSDDNRSLGKHVFANRTAFPIWYDFYTALSEWQLFTYDAALQEIIIDGKTGEQCVPKRKGALRLLIPKNHRVVGHLTVAS